MDATEYGRIVKNARTKKGLTQEELAENCRLGLRTIQRIETGKVTPRAHTVKLINEILDLSITDYREITRNPINYLSIFYSGISIIGLSIIFTAAVNYIIGILFFVAGFTCTIIGFKHRSTWEK